jgi:hypothetical protein
MNDNYIFDSKNVAGQSLVHLINLYFRDNIVGAEIGVGRGENLCTFLQQCPKIKKMYGVDPYTPYNDCLNYPYTGIPVYTYNFKEVEANKLIALHNIKFSGYKDKVTFLEKTSKEAVNEIEDNSLDFLFLDTFIDQNSIIEDIDLWYKKVKPGGIFSGHDWQSLLIQSEVNNFRKKNKITNTLSTFDFIWVWIK